MKNYFELVKYFIKIIFVALLLTSSVFPQNEFAEDTVKISLETAEQIFLQHNLQLLAAKYNINAAKASIIQAHIWNNPNLSIGQNIYNKFTSKYFDFSKTGNTDLQLQQLFLLAGKRNDQIKLAQINSEVAEDSFYDLLRTLKFELRTNFYNLYFLQKSEKFYDNTIPSVQKTVDAAQRIYEQHAILLSEVLRLKSLLFSLQNERLGIENQIYDIQNNLNVLLSDSTNSHSYFSPQLNVAFYDSLNANSISLNDALGTALENRPDVKIAASNVIYEKTNLTLQKALAIPDLTIGGSYSRNGGYIRDYLALTLSVDLPIFNRNQGNIQVSENTLEENKILLNQAKQSVKKEVVSAYEKALETDNLYKNFDRAFPNQYEKLTSGMIANYESRNMTIIEFTDFYESYRTSMLQMIQLQDSRINAFEQLNYAVGKDILFPKHK